VSHWNYRVVRKAYPPGKDGTIEYVLGIHEVYYDDNGEPEMVTEDRMDPHGETLEELRDDIEHMRLALDKPVLDYETFGANATDGAKETK
jgi:hypothetical protein